MKKNHSFLFNQEKKRAGYGDKKEKFTYMSELKASRLNYDKYPDAVNKKSKMAKKIKKV